MFGQAINRYLSPTLLLLMVAFFFTVHLTSDLASNADNLPHDLDNFARMHLSLTDSRSLGDFKDWQKCVAYHLNETRECTKKAKKEEFHEITDKECRTNFSFVKCATENFCHNCKEINFEEYSKILKDELVGDECKQWDNLKPKLPTNCSDGGEPNDHSPKSEAVPFYKSLTFYIFAVVLGVVVICGGVIWFCICCSGGGEGSGSGRDTRSRHSKSVKAKSQKAKSQKAKSKKSKSAKSVKSKKAKSAKSSKSKSAKQKGIQIKIF